MPRTKKPGYAHMSEGDDDESNMEIELPEEEDGIAPLDFHVYEGETLEIDAPDDEALEELEEEE